MGQIGRNVPRSCRIRERQRRQGERRIASQEDRRIRAVTMLVRGRGGNATPLGGLVRAVLPQRVMRRLYFSALGSTSRLTPRLPSSRWTTRTRIGQCFGGARSELNMSATIGQLPSGWRWCTTRYLPVSAIGLAPGGAMVMMYFPVT